METEGEKVVYTAVRARNAACPCVYYFMYFYICFPTASSLSFCWFFFLFLPLPFFSLCFLPFTLSLTLPFSLSSHGEHCGLGHSPCPPLPPVPLWRRLGRLLGGEGRGDRRALPHHRPPGSAYIIVVSGRAHRALVVS